MTTSKVPTELFLLAVAHEAWSVLRRDALLPDLSFSSVHAVKRTGDWMVRFTSMCGAVPSQVTVLVACDVALAESSAEVLDHIVREARGLLRGRASRVES